jgi:amino acid permease
MAQKHIQAVDPLETTPLLDESLTGADHLIKEPTEKTGDEQTIGYLGSLVYVVNQIYGIGILALPLLFQQVGPILMVVFLLFFTAVSSLASTMITEAMALIPGNENFQRRLEFSNLALILFGKKFYYMQQLFFNVSMQSLNIASIIITAQPVDSLLTIAFGRTYAITLYPHIEFITVTYDTLDKIYGNDFGLSISLGYLLILCIFLPLGFLDLNANIYIQYGAFFLMIFLLAEFSWHFVKLGLNPENVQVFGTHTFSQVISIFILSYAYPMLIPSWINAKKTHVSVNAVIWFSGLLAFIGYILIGLFGAMAYPSLNSDDVMDDMTSKSTELITRIAVYVFSFSIVATSIPVYSISVKYNLFIGGLCGKKQAIFWGIIAPWLVGFVFMHAQFFAAFLNWTSLIFSGIENFLIPFLCYWKAQKNYVELHGKPGSFVNALPKWLLPFWRQFSLGLFGTLLGMIVFQTFICLFYLIVLHKNILGN